MTPMLAIAALVAFGLGFYLGRETGRSPGGSPCPKCRGKRLYYCSSCGVHFDEKDEALAPHEHPRWQEAKSRFPDGVPPYEKVIPTVLDPMSYSPLP